MSNRAWRFLKKLLIAAVVLSVVLLLSVAFLVLLSDRTADNGGGQPGPVGSNQTDTGEPLLKEEMLPELIDLPPKLLEMKGAVGNKLKYGYSVKLTITVAEAGRDPITHKISTVFATENEVVSMSRFGLMKIRSKMFELKTVTLVNGFPVSVYDSDNPPTESEIVDNEQLQAFADAMRTVSITSREPTGNFADVIFEYENGEPVEDPKTVDWMEQSASKEQLVLPDYPVSKGDRWPLTKQIVPMGVWGRMERDYNAELSGFVYRDDELLALIGLSADVRFIKSPDLSGQSTLEEHEDLGVMLFSVDRGLLLRNKNVAKMKVRLNLPEGPVTVESVYDISVELLDE